MKKIILLVIALLIMPVIVLADTVTIEDIKLVDKSEGLAVSDPEIDGLNININPYFIKVGDFVKYEITLQNNGPIQYSVTPVNTSDDYITYELTDIKTLDKNGSVTAVLTVTYKNKIPGNDYVSNEELGYLFEYIVEEKPEKQDSQDNTTPEEKPEEQNSQNNTTPVETPEEQKSQDNTTPEQTPKELDKKDNTTQKLLEVPDTHNDTPIIVMSILFIAISIYIIIAIVYYKKLKYTIPFVIGFFALGTIGICTSYIIRSTHANVALSIKVNLSVEKQDSLYNKILSTAFYNLKPRDAKAYALRRTTPNFSKAATTNEGMFAAEDDNGTAFYYRGAVSNNYVIFGGFCWRIVRTTGTGGVKMIYDGVPSSGVCNNTNASIGNVIFNPDKNSPAYVGYMYGEVRITENDDITTKPTNIIFSNNATYNSETGMYELDMDNSYEMIPSNWNSSDSTINYKQTLKKHYTCLSDKTSCKEVYYITHIDTTLKVDAVQYQTLSNGENINDLLDMMLTNSSNTTSSTAKIKIDNWYENNLKSYESYLEDTIFCNDRTLYSYGGWNKDNENENLYFGAYGRIKKNQSPSLICPKLNDRFTVNEGIGNGDLTYPIGLLTADEMSMAGAADNVKNSNLYLFNGSVNWYGSPYYVNNGGPNVSQIGSNGQLYSFGFYYSRGIRPAISLKAGTIVSSGNGSSNTPYIIETK